MAFDLDKPDGSVTPVRLKPKGEDIYTIFPTSYTTKNHCQMLGSPSEWGLKQFDNKVIQPSTVQLTGIIKSENAESTLTKLRKQIKMLSLENTLCEFQGKGGTMQKMIIESIEEVGEPNRYDAVEVRISLLEFLEHSKS